MVCDPIKNVSIIILAAGLGTRMKSNMAKVLHKVKDKPMISHVLLSACEVAGKNVIVVVGHQADLVKDACLKVSPVSFALQKEQRGTGHAVLCAMPEIPDTTENVIILCGDVPLLKTETIRALLADHIKGKRDLSLLAVELEDPTGYGRVVINRDRELTRIVEEADARAAQQFQRGEMPKVYDALKIESAGLTLEVQQQLGDGVVRAIAMGSTDGLKRGVQKRRQRVEIVEREVVLPQDRHPQTRGEDHRTRTGLDLSGQDLENGRLAGAALFVSDDYDVGHCCL